MPSRLVVVYLCLFFVGFIASPARASLLDPYSQGVMDPVSFQVVDDPNSVNPGAVVLSTTSFGLPVGYQLEYQYSEVSDWTLLGPATTFTTAVEGSALVFLRLYNPSTGAEDTRGELTFQGLEGSDLFTSLIIDWDGAGPMSLSITTAGNDDNLAPVPLPGAIWLLASGLAGIVGVRRKRGS